METYSYAASKSGLIHLTRRMAVKLISDHIVVSAIAPGPFKSDMNKAARDNADEVAQRVPAGRIGTDEDMAGAAIYLASRAGDYVVGATIAVDGGIVYANPGIKGDGWDRGKLIRLDVIAAGFAHRRLQRRPVERGAAADIGESFIDAAFHALEAADVDVGMRITEQIAATAGASERIRSCT